MALLKAQSGPLIVTFLVFASAAFAEEPLPVARLPEAAGALGQAGTGAENPAPGKGGAKQKHAYQDLFTRESAKYGLPPALADAVAAIESDYDPAAAGSAGEIGLMQILPSTAAMLGFAGNAAELAKPEVNIHYGVTYLGEAWQLAGGDLCRTLMKYRAGHGEEVMSALSASYCQRARAQLAAAGSPLAGPAVIPLVFTAPSRLAPKRGPRIRTATTSRAFWRAEEARVRLITQRLEEKWRRVALR